MLRDLTIQNYRCFKDFHIDGLARVNLIVGKNNSGKTSLLEAVYLLVSLSKLQCLIDLLRNRGEIALARSIHASELMRPGYQITHIFYDRQLRSEQAVYIQSKQEFSLAFKISLEFPQEKFQNFKNIDTEWNYLKLVFSSGENSSELLIPVYGNGLIQIEPVVSITPSTGEMIFTNPSLFLTTSNLSFEQLAMLWNEITLTPKEESVVAALQILEPNIERISFTSYQTYNSGILLKVRGQRDPIFLGSMGEGMQRILTLAMAAVTVENGFLLIDEIETGLYYETQTDMWRLILEIAQQLNVQVFATTHSWDCICAFQEALEQLEDSSAGKLFRLSRRGEDIRAVEYTPDELSVAVRQSIEVR